MKFTALSASALLFAIAACSTSKQMDIPDGMDDLVEYATETFGPKDSGDISDVFGKATSPNNPYGGRRIPAGYSGDYHPAPGNGVYWTSPDGCTYSRTQAPGHEPEWYLVLNPHHIGKPNAHAQCANMVREMRG